MKTIKVSDLIGAPLEWAVATCEASRVGATIKTQAFLRGMEIELFEFSTSWMQGGPIIEREGITLLRLTNDWEAQCGWQPVCSEAGPTPLVAAMRCYVASKLGDTVGVPEELS